MRPISKKLFDIYALFTREPFVQYFTKELEFYSNADAGLLGLISLDITDDDYSVCILSRDSSKQYRAVLIDVSISSIEEAREWIHENMKNMPLESHDNKSQYFDIFEERALLQQHR